MPTNEEGEFELILGNRQLLSVFFIVVILLGLFFTMGYIVGQHSTPLVTADASAAKNAAKSVVEDSPRETAPPPETPRETAPEPPPTRPSEPVRTAPQQPPETPKPVKPEPKAEPAKPEPAKAAKSEKSKAAEKKAEAPAASITTPSGTYLQLAATTKREADIMVDVLRQKKFSATTAQVPEKPDLYRVLVGPVSEGQVNKTKSDLQSAGFPGDKSIKRTF